jgi:hypothetical protein
VCWETRHTVERGVGGTGENVREGENGRQKWGWEQPGMPGL